MLYRMGNEYQINTDMPWAKHFEWAEPPQAKSHPKPEPAAASVTVQPPAPTPTSELTEREKARREAAAERFRQMHAKKRAALEQPKSPDEGVTNGE